MTAPSAILAIDQGTSGTKAVVVDAVEGAVASAEVTVRPRYGAGGSVEVDAHALLASVVEAGTRALELAERPVRCVALANQGETVLAWDRATGLPLSAAVVWQDRRSEALVAELTASRELVAERTGLVLDSYFSAPKMAWLRRHVTTDGVVTTSDSWLIHRLCGAFVTDVSTASRSLITSLDYLAWDEELLGVFGLGDEDLPRIADCDEVVGMTTLFGGELPVAGLIVDQQAALLAESCLQPGSAKCTFGTGAFLLANTGSRPRRSTAGLTASAAWRLRDQTTYCLDGQVYAAASAIRWLADLGLIAGAEDVDRVAAAEAGGVLCVPALAGLAGPWWRSEATATFTGMSLATNTGQLVRAAIEGIAAQVAALTSSIAIDLGAPLQRLRVDGGLVRCRTLMQATADIAQLPMDVYPFEHATALGAAATGRLALEPELAIADAVPAWTAADTYEPRWSVDRAADFRARWLDVADTTMTR